MKDVQCYELFGGIALKNHASSFNLPAHLVYANNVQCFSCFFFQCHCYAMLVSQVVFYFVSMKELCGLMRNST